MILIHEDNGVCLNEHVSRQSTDFDDRTGRIRFLQPFCHDLVDDGEVFKIGEIEGELQRIV